MSANGKLRSDELAFVQGGIRLANTTAAAWRAFRADVYVETGVLLTISEPDGGYRSYERQTVLTGTGNHKYRPGYSVHGTGRCVDVWNHGAVPRKTLVAIARRHGFTFTISTEPWHMQHDGVTVVGGGAVGGSNPESPEEDEMSQQQVQFIAAQDAATYKGRSVGANQWAVIDEWGRYTRIQDGEELTAIGARLGKTRAEVEQLVRPMSGRAFLLNEGLFIRLQTETATD